MLQISPCPPTLRRYTLLHTMRCNKYCPALDFPFRLPPSDGHPSPSSVLFDNSRTPPLLFKGTARALSLSHPPLTVNPMHKDTHYTVKAIWIYSQIYKRLRGYNGFWVHCQIYMTMWIYILINTCPCGYRTV
jgi:hypothetical protein